MSSEFALADSSGRIGRLCQGRPSAAHLFVHPSGCPWNRNIPSNRFKVIQERAGVRDGIVLYGFRRLRISQMPMARMEELLVARMTGTSVATIERVYGHLRNQSYEEAQGTARGAARGLRSGVRQEPCVAVGYGWGCVSWASLRGRACG
jgi:hypothetical protein